jgi:hypothetical protein
MRAEANGGGAEQGRRKRTLRSGLPSVALNRNPPARRVSSSLALYAGGALGVEAEVETGKDVESREDNGGAGEAVADGFELGYQVKERAAGIGEIEVDGQEHDAASARG